ncbi:Bgt-51933 [Blumeria graminis f. sp. tritici]|uniref:Bgt-51933 n=1 Tax=Blumeria graminis f. sp. tritici TaxID=62690 RepID=A0A9X9MPS2_BLUGR|nr:Bgt-51933 [Blumeria graminis f. sp. tritici]
MIITSLRTFDVRDSFKAWSDMIPGG